MDVKTAIIFPGQGSQYVGMGEKLVAKHKIARQTFDEASEALGIDLLKLCLELDSSELSQTKNSQPAILTASVASYRVFSQEYEVEPQIMLGHSLGEYSALVCAGAIEFSDAVKIVRNRGIFMQEAVPLGIGAMAAICKIDVGVIEEQCRQYMNKFKSVVSISSYNSPNQITIAGYKEAVESVSNNLRQMGAVVIPVKVSGPFHTELMTPVMDKLKVELNKYQYNEFKYPILSNVSALPYKSKEEITSNLIKQVVSPVRWQQCVRYVDGLDIENIIEVGPGKVLTKLVRQIVPERLVYSYDKEYENLRKDASKYLINTDNNAKFKAIITKCLTTAISAKNSNWNGEEYEEKVIRNYNIIKDMQAHIDSYPNIQVTTEEVIDILNKLKIILETKGVEKEIQNIYFNRIIEETGTQMLLKYFKLPLLHE